MIIISQNTQNVKCEYQFRTIEKQRFLKDNTPLTLCPVIASQCDFENDAWQHLNNEFMRRYTILASLGKTPDGDFSPFLKIKQKSFKRQNVFIEHTHFTFSFTFKNKKGEESQGFPVLIIDIDKFNGDLSIFKRLNIVPNYLIMNPEKPTSLQAGYVLDTPIFKNACESFDDYEEDTPQGKFISCFKTLNGILNGDTNFKLHNAKNPFFATKVGAVAWTSSPTQHIDELYRRVEQAKTHYIENFDAFELDNRHSEKAKKGIAEHIKTHTEPHKNYVFDENSRNCALFDEMRLLAYEMSAEYVETGDSSSFYNYLLDIAMSKNDNGLYLPLAEIIAMCRSIVKYCFKNHVACKYPSYQKRRLDKMSLAKEYMLKEFGANYRYSAKQRAELAQKFDVKPDTIKTYASQIRKEHGSNDEKFRMFKEIEGLRSTTPPTKWARISDLLGISEAQAKMIYKRQSENTKETNNGN